MAWYKTGTITLANGSATVTGSGTAFAGNVEAGMMLIHDMRVIGEVQEVVSATELTLAEPYSGATITAEPYAIINLGSVRVALLEAFAWFRDQITPHLSGSLIGRFQDGTPTEPGIAFKEEVDLGFRRKADGVISATGALEVPSLGGQAVAQSPEDTRPGVIPTPGWMGLGGAVNDPDHISYKTHLQGITRFFGHTTSSSPPADGPIDNGFVGWQAAAAENRMGAMFIKAQGALGPDGNQAWITGKDGSWADFSELYHNHNLLGTVSQSGGVPTGAVIERGSNANGDYVRFADGTQICRKRVTFDGSPVTWNFPVGFADNPAVSFAPVSGGARSVSFLYEATSSIEFRVFESDGSLAGTTSVMLTAFGEWF